MNRISCLRIRCGEDNFEDLSTTTRCCSSLFIDFSEISLRNGIRSKIVCVREVKARRLVRGLTYEMYWRLICIAGEIDGKLLDFIL